MGGVDDEAKQGQSQITKQRRDRAMSGCCVEKT